MKWKNKGKEYEKIISSILDQNVDVYIWGAGTFGRSFYELFKDRINIKGFIDSDENKQCLGLQPNVYLPKYFFEMLLNENVHIIVASGWITEIYGQLGLWGLTEYKNYFHANEFT